MKKIFTLLFSLVVLGVSAQTISLSADTVVLRHGSKIDYGTYFITNSASGSIDIDCTIKPLCYDSNDDAAIAICFGPLCFAPVSTETTFGVLLQDPVTTIGAGATDDTFKFEPFSSETHGSTWSVEFFEQSDPTNKATLIVYIEGCDPANTVSVSDNFEEANFTTAPNPASEMITLGFESINSKRTLSIYNALGQLQDTEVVGANVVSHTKNISNLNNGYYFLKMTTEDGASAVKKLLVRK